MVFTCEHHKFTRVQIMNDRDQGTGTDVMDPWRRWKAWKACFHAPSVGCDSGSDDACYHRISEQLTPWHYCSQLYVCSQANIQLHEATESLTLSKEQYELMPLAVVYIHIDVDAFINHVTRTKCVCGSLSASGILKALRASGAVSSALVCGRAV
jgi:hypothetical protein